jgi:hypothetical protein
VEEHDGAAKVDVGVGEQDIEELASEELAGCG